MHNAVYHLSLSTSTLDSILEKSAVLRSSTATREQRSNSAKSPVKKGMSILWYDTVAAALVELFPGQCSA